MPNTESLMAVLNTVGVSEECGEPGLGWDIQQHAWELAVFVQRMQALGVHTVLEIGTGRTGGLARFMTHILGWKVTSIDPNVPTALSGEFIRGKSQDPEVYALVKERKYDLVFIDGDHSYEGCSADFRMYSGLATKAIAIHDIAMGRPDLEGVGQLWSEVAYLPGSGGVRYGAHEILATEHALGIGWLEADPTPKKAPRVAAIVSVFNARDFLRGRLDNLLGQTIADELEIVCVNAGSHHHEDGYILEEYATLHPQVKVLNTLRDPQMESWNLGIRHTQAEYVTNQNCDDRMAPWGLEVLAEHLDKGFDVAYGNAYCISDRESKWDGRWSLFKEPQSYPDGIIDWGYKEFSVQALYEGCFLGPFPMWRRSLHEKAGWFDPSYAYAGDYEMWLRFAAAGGRFVNVPFYLGTFYSDYSQLSRLDPWQLGTENQRIHLKYRGLAK